jgi:hypothetical protein
MCFFPRAGKSKLLTIREIKNPDRKSGLSLVDKVIEISNLELVKDIIELHAAFTSWKDYSPLVIPQ